MSYVDGTMPDIREKCFTVLGITAGDIDWGNGILDLSLFDDTLSSLPAGKVLLNLATEALTINDIGVDSSQLEKINWVKPQLIAQYGYSQDVSIVLEQYTSVRWKTV